MSEGHDTPIRHHSYLILLTQASMNDGATTPEQSLGIRAFRTNVFRHLICTILTNTEEVEVLNAILSKSHPTTFTLNDGQLHLEREFTEYHIGTTRSEFSFQLFTGVISPTGKLTRSAITHAM